MSCAQATAEALYLDAQQRLIAVVVHPRDAKEVAVPEKTKESHHDSGQ